MNKLRKSVFHDGQKSTKRNGHVYELKGYIWFDGHFSSVIIYVSRLYVKWCIYICFILDVLLFSNKKIVFDLVYGLRP